MSYLDGQPLYEDDQTVVTRGDAMRVLSGIPEGSIDLILADPPYSSGGMFRGDRAQVDVVAEIECAASAPDRVLDLTPGDTSRRPTADLVPHADPAPDEATRLECVRRGRQLSPVREHHASAPSFENAPRFREPQRGPCEVCPLIPTISSEVLDRLSAAVGADVLGRRTLPNIIRSAIPREARDLHQTPKSVEMLARLCTLAPPGGVVLDPFTGSGSTLVAARRMGRRGIGVELSATHAATAAARIEQETLQLDLLADAA